jgi:hypothetical protein
VSLALLTPFTAGPATRAGSKWRKKLLPIGEINYKGRVLKFTHDYLAGLVQSFKERAYDQVPFQLAPDNNAHTNDPERTRGQIQDMTLEHDGLWITMEPTDAGRAVLEANPGLGVSARIVEGYDRSDGKLFPRAIQHVLGTLDPRIPGMGGWEAVAAANDVQVTVDLSGESFTLTQEETPMPDLDEAQQKKLATLLGLDVDKLAAVIGQMPEGTAPDPAALGEGGDDLGDLDDAELDAIMAQIDGMSDQELAEWEAALEAEEGGAEPEPAAAGLSAETVMALELASAQGDENARQLAIIQGQLDTERWQGERRKLIAGGVPPFIADLAQPLLEGAGHVVDLANGTSVDAGSVMRKVLAEYAKVTQALELGAELGTTMDEPDQESEAAKERADIVQRAKDQLGLV